MNTNDTAQAAVKLYSLLSVPHNGDTIVKEPIIEDIIKM